MHPLAPASLTLGTLLEAPVVPETAGLRARAYLVGCGYLERPDGRFERGTGLFTAFSFSPAAWGVDVQVELARAGEGTSGRSVFTVTATGQTPTSWELAFWRQEVLGLKEAIERDVNTASASRRLARRANALNLLFAVALLAVFFGPTGTVAWLAQAREWDRELFGMVAVPTALASMAAAALLMGLVGGDVATLPRAEAPPGAAPAPLA